MENEEKYITLSFVLLERKFKASLLPNIYTATKKNVFNSDKRYRSSTTQDTTVLGSKTVHNPCQQEYTGKQTL